jgi:uncharacterized protein YkwD
MRIMANRLSYPTAIAAIALFGCWDSVATPIRIPADGGVAKTDAGGEPRDAAVTVAGDVPDTRYCDPVANWPEQWADAELALFDAINELRESRPRCGSRDFDGERFPLWLSPELRCAARLNSQDLDRRESVNIVLKTPEERVGPTGFRARPLDEAIVTGVIDHAEVLENLRESPEHCDKLFTRDFGAIGIGVYKDHWTLDFAGFARP